MRLDGAEVAAGVLRQVAERADVVDRLAPAVERLVDRDGPRQGGAARRPDVDPPAVDLVGDAQLERRDAGQDVELVEHDAAHAVHGDGIPQRHGIEPADPARPAGDRPEFVAALGDAGPDLVVQFGRVRPGPDPRRVGLHHADDLVDLERPDAAARARAAGDRVGRGHERVAAVVEVEERALRALQEDVLAARQRRLDEPGGVVEVIAEAFAPAGGLVDERFDLERLGCPCSRAAGSCRAGPGRSARAGCRGRAGPPSAGRAARPGRHTSVRCHGRSCRPWRRPGASRSPGPGPRGTA